MTSVIGIYIQGFKDGEYPVEENCSAEHIEDMPEEYKGLLRVHGKLRKLLNRYIVEAVIEVTAYLQCDLSLEEYTESISTEIRATFMMGVPNHMADEHNNVFVISDDSKEIPLDSVIREELVLALPLKRVAPQWRDKEWKQPADTIDNNTRQPSSFTDERWAVLKNLQQKTQNN